MAARNRPPYSHIRRQRRGGERPSALPFQDLGVSQRDEARAGAEEEGQDQQVSGGDEGGAAAEQGLEEQLLPLLLLQDGEGGRDGDGA